MSEIAMSDLIGPEIITGLGLNPEMIQKFELIFEAGKPVDIKVTFGFIVDKAEVFKGIAQATKRYQLIEI